MAEKVIDIDSLVGNEYKLAMTNVQTIKAPFNLCKAIKLSRTGENGIHILSAIKYDLKNLGEAEKSG